MEANTTTKHIIRSSLWIMFFFAMSRVTGLVKIITTSSQFGTGGDPDAFTAANQIPELFTIMISGGAFSAALIPVYSQYVLGKDKQSQEGLANTALTIVFGSLSLLALLGILFAPVMTSTFLMRGADPAVQQLTAELIRILLISMVIVGVSGVFGAILNANQHFISPAISTVTIDLGHIAGLVFLAPVFGIKGVAYGSVIGAACHLLVQVPALIRYGIGFMPQLGLQLQATRQMLRLLIPRMVMLGTQQLIDIWLISLR